jgi:D-beta-D-heptose 7-phosphate kinase/D-beta-D-heptose 1-phosphate adenosyltransferase
MTRPVDAVDQWPSLRVAVVGDALLDVWLEGSANRLCREAPVPVTHVTSRCDLPGGAGNTAVNVQALAGKVSLVSVIGDDPDGARFRQSLLAAGVEDAHLVCAPWRQTLALHRLLAGGHLIGRFDCGTTEPIAAATDAKVIGELEAVIPGADAVIISDYGHGMLTDPVLDALDQLVRETGPLLMVDSKHPARFRRLHPTAVKPNWIETVELLGSGRFDGTEERAEGVASKGARLLELTDADIVAVTLDTDGAVVFERGRPPHRTYAQPARSSSTVGAGDTFMAALTLALAGGAPTPAAAELASAAAEVVVAKDRTAVCSAQELRRRFAIGGKLLSLADLVNCVELHRREGRRITFTNGCFDILHRGHITYLNRAKNLGDVLIVGMNDDDSVRRLKGQHRPINPLEDRAEVLAALSCVDHLVTFSGDSPTDILSLIRPDVYTKGGDYTKETLPEAPVVEALGGQVHILPFMEDRSTTGMLERITARSLCNAVM